MLSVLLITFPFFALVLCGYLATRAGALPVSAIGGLNSFVLYFALPCMLYRFGASTPIAQLLDPAVAGLYLLCALLMVGGTVALTLRRRGWNDAAFGALVASVAGSARAATGSASAARAKTSRRAPAAAGWRRRWG